MICYLSYDDAMIGYLIYYIRDSMYHVTKTELVAMLVFATTRNPQVLVGVEIQIYKNHLLQISSVTAYRQILANFLAVVVDIHLAPYILALGMLISKT